MKVSREGLIEIASHEGIVSSPYHDSVGIWTVGVGHTESAGSPNPAIARREFPIAEVMEIFARDIDKFEGRVNRAFKVKLMQHEFDAAVSFDFNTGGIFKASWVKNFNAGNKAAAKSAFMRWRKPPEIIPRREKECALFFKGKYTSGGFANVYPASASGRVIWSKGKLTHVGRLMNGAMEPHREPPATTVPIPPLKPETPQASTGGGWLAGLIGMLAKLFGGHSK
jgi:lysozyme